MTPTTDQKGRRMVDGMSAQGELARGLVALLALVAWVFVILAAGWSDPPPPVLCACETDGECETKCP